MTDDPPDTDPFLPTTADACRTAATPAPTITLHKTDYDTTDDPPRKPKKPLRYFRFYDPRKNLLSLPDGTPISRNSPCFCGSGRRYKRCCKNAHGRRQKVLQTIAMTGLSPGLHRLEECTYCAAAKLRPILNAADRGRTSLRRTCGSCQLVRPHVCVDIMLNPEPEPA